MFSEAQTYIERFHELRKNTIKTLDGLGASGLNWKPTRKDTNSLFVLATHLIGSERYWIHQAVGQRAVSRDRDAEFRARGASADAFSDALAEVARTSDEILGALTLADLDVERKGNLGAHTVRWCILHMIEHYAEHSGQMSLTRQLWEGQERARAKVKWEKAKVRRKR